MAKKFFDSLRALQKINEKNKIGKYIAVGGILGASVVGLATPVFANELELHVPVLPWPHNGILSTYDHASLRRGYQVYKQVCSACHSMSYLTYRHLIGHVLTEDEAKNEAAGIQVRDGPNDVGDMYDRPGKITDTLPNPYANSKAARAANNGALPPDFTFIAKGRHQKEDYIFHLLTGYIDPPPGREVPEGQHYNPYFPGGSINMARPLYDEAIEFEDGTPASTSQMAKDVCEFLTWTSDRTHDQRKRVLFKCVVALGIALTAIGIYKRKKWSIIKTKKIIYKNRPMPKEL